MIAAPRALATGLVSAVHPDGALRAAGVALARRMCARSSALGLRLTKLQLRAAADGQALAGAVHTEDARQVLCLNEPRTQAFLAAQAARFSGGGGKKRKKKGQGAARSKL